MASDWWGAAVLVRALPAPPALTALCRIVAGFVGGLLSSACPTCECLSFIGMALQQVLRLLLWLLWLV